MIDATSGKEQRAGKSAITEKERNRVAFLGVTDGEKRGKGGIDHWGPFRATAKLVEMANFLRVWSNLDPPSWRKTP